MHCCMQVWFGLVGCFVPCAPYQKQRIFRFSCKWTMGRERVVGIVPFQYHSSQVHHAHMSDNFIDKLVGSDRSPSKFSSRVLAIACRTLTESTCQPETVENNGLLRVVRLFGFACIHVADLIYTRNPSGSSVSWSCYAGRVHFAAVSRSEASPSLRSGYDMTSWRKCREPLHLLVTYIVISFRRLERKSLDSWSLDSWSLDLWGGRQLQKGAWFRRFDLICSTLVSVIETRTRISRQYSQRRIPYSVCDACRPVHCS
ncbi:hypothetical protein F4808DRAFT_122234 [Astrocystis sublimbata]|nr:hypothetical protein F4808DRAFT_122234 [Astrocystis sublimbata]